MRAVRFSEYGGPEVLRVDEVDEPHAGSGHVRVAVKAAGVNPIDWKIRSGMMAGGTPLAAPRIIGSDASGVVDEVGDGVTDVSVGDDVFGSGSGGAAAEFAVLDNYAVKPATLGWSEAAGWPVPVETAERGLDLLGLEAGQTLLLNGAAGGVGIAVVQLARARGARVIGTAGAGNHDFLRQLGAEPTTYGEGLVDRVRELAPEGVDLAFDAAGHGALPALIELTGSPDNVITIADFSAPEHGVRVTTGGGARAWHGLTLAAELFEQGRFALPVAQTFPFERAGDAHLLSADGHVRGKLVLVAEVAADD